QALDSEVNLAHVEAGYLEIKSEIEDGKLSQLLGQELAVPGRVLRQAIVGDCKSASLRGVKMFDRDDRNFGPSQFLRRKTPAMAGDHGSFGIDQHRHIEAETCNAIGDLPNLLAAMQPRVFRIEPQMRNRLVTDVQFTITASVGGLAHCRHV